MIPKNSIETNRLLLRPHRIDDFPYSAEMWADPKIVTYIGGKPSNEQQAWSRLLNYAGHWALMDFGYWAVEEKSTGTFVGEIGFADFKRVITPPIREIPELGWALVSAAHGKGYATEGVNAALSWGKSNLKSVRTVCLIDPGNLASTRVAQKCGFKKSHEAEYNGAITIVHSRSL